MAATVASVNQYVVPLSLEGRDSFDQLIRKGKSLAQQPDERREYY
jgi:hypothetical protein